MSYLEQLIRNLDETGRIVFQGAIMSGCGPRQALLNAYGVCESDELTRDPFTAYWTVDSLPLHVRDAILGVQENIIENLFWDIWENR